MRILLLNPVCGARESLLPLGLGYVASSLLSEGHHIEILDLDITKKGPQKVVPELHGRRFDAVGITGILSQYRYVKELCSIMKEQYDVPIVVGGVGITSAPEIYMSKIPIDVGVIAEGEETCKEVFNVLERSGDPSEIRGIWYKKKNQVNANPSRPVVADIDTIPFPAWGLLDMDTYMKNMIHPVGDIIGSPFRSMGISTSRGCPFRCGFCYPVFKGLRTRYRSAPSIIEEARVLVEKYHVDYIGFMDDLFLVDKKRILEFCALVKKERLDFKWGTSARTNLVTRELLQEMASAGCICLGYGFESASQTVLDSMRKQTTVEDHRRAIEWMREAGIRIQGSWIIGYPGETEATVKETKRFIKETGVPFNGFFFATPLPDTELWKTTMERNLFEKSGFRDPEDILLSYSEFGNTLLINYTAMSDERLREIKMVAERELIKNNTHASLTLAFRYWKRHGLLRTITRAMRFLGTVLGH